MRTGEMLVGSGENMFNGLEQVNPEDVSRNRNRNIIPRFFTRQVKLADGSGYHEVEYLELLIPGDSKSSPCHLVDDRLRQQYARNYQAFREGKELPTDGTAVEHWLGADNSYTLVLKSMHLRTVEAVADMSDAVCKELGLGGTELRRKAQVFLEVQRDGVKADELAAKDNTIEDLKRRLAALEGRGVQEGDPADESMGDDDESYLHRPPGSHPVSEAKKPGGRKK